MFTFYVLPFVCEYWLLKITDNLPVVANFIPFYILMKLFGHCTSFLLIVCHPDTVIALYSKLRLKMLLIVSVDV